MSAPTNLLSPYMLQAQRIVLAATARGLAHTEAIQQLADLLCTPAANHDLVHADDELAVLRVELASVRDNWTVSLQAGNEAVKALEAARALKSQLLDALKLQADDHQRFHPHHAHLCPTCTATAAALSAAGAA